MKRLKKLRGPNAIYSVETQNAARTNLYSITSASIHSRGKYITVEIIVESVGVLDIFGISIR